MSPSDYAAEILGSALAEDWSETLRRLDQFDRDGFAHDLDPVLDQFLTEVAASR